MTRAIVVVLACAVLNALMGCQRGPHRRDASDLPTYAQIEERYNERTERLDRIWARATVSIEFDDEDGKRRYQQGDGHFQLIQPSRLALSIGKLGETLLWIGCDEERYWLLEPREHRRGFVGRHDRLTRGKTQSLGIPVAPLEMIHLLGVTSIPELPPSGSSLAWDEEGENLVLDLPEAGGGLWRHHLDPETLRPALIELIPAGAESPLLSARLSSYEGVSIRGEGGFFPRIASRIWLTHHAENALLRMSLEGMVDGGRHRLSPEVFELDALVYAMGITDLRNLDAPRPALSQGEGE